jgi:4-carboxymuconolactone decarboxylase
MSDALRKELADLEKKGLAMRRKVHPAGHVERVQDETDDFMMMFNRTTNQFCWGAVWTRPGLTVKQRSALSLAISAANGQTGAVEMHTRTALKAGWTREEIGEIFLHVYVYAGVYGSLNAFLTAKRVFEEIDREAGAKPARNGGARVAKATTANHEQVAQPISGKSKAGKQKSALAERGLEIRRELIGPENIDAWQKRYAGNAFMNMFFDFTHKFCFGAVWSRPGLDHKMRDILTLGIAAGMGQEGAVRRHLRSALRVGLTRRQIGEIFLHVYIYGGCYNSLRSFLAADEEFKIIDAEKRQARKRKA